LNAIAPSQPSLQDSAAREIMLTPAPISADTTCGRMFDLIAADDSMPGMAVVVDPERDHRVLGYIDRFTLLMTFARPVLRDLYERRPVERLMDPHPLLVDVNDSIEGINSRIAREKPEAVMRGFVVLSGGRYAGVSTALRLMTKATEQADRRSCLLEEARHAAEAANRAKTTFLANISHELRTPLNAVIGFAEVLQSEMLGPLGTAKYLEYVTDIHDSGRHLLELINNLLDLAKADVDRLTLSEETLDIVAVAQTCLRLLTEQANRRGVTLRSVHGAGRPCLTADHGKVRQMLLNLLSNALKFTPNGGRVTLGTKLRPGGELAVAVTDTGIGMTEDEQQMALQPFTQIDNRLTRSVKGTGLGLPLTKRLVELHGGRMEMSSVPGKGTTVTLLFPASRLRLSPNGDRAVPAGIDHAAA